MENNVLRKIFTFSGIFPLTYDPNTHSYKVSSVIVIYSFFFILLTEIFNFYGIDRYIVDISSTLYEGLKDESTGKMIVLLDFSAWMSIVSSTPIMIFLKRHQFRMFLNDLLVFKEAQKESSKDQIRAFQKRLERTILTLLLLTILAIPPSLTMFEHLPLHWRLIHIYAMSLHLILGQLFEYLIFKWLCFYFRTVHIDLLTLTNHVRLHFWICKYTKLVRLCKHSCQLFGVLKVIHLTSANLLMSIYVFYNYDRVTNVLSIMLWQLMILSIYYLCCLWDELSTQVSSFNVLRHFKRVS